MNPPLANGSRADAQTSTASRWRPFSGFDPYLPDRLDSRQLGKPLGPAPPSDSYRHSATQTADQPDRELPGVPALSVQTDVGSLHYVRHRRHLAPAVALPSNHPKADLPDALPSYEAMYHLFGYADASSKPRGEHLTHGSRA